jgi:hypothetical protein
MSFWCQTNFFLVADKDQKYFGLNCEESIVLLTVIMSVLLECITLFLPLDEMGFQVLGIRCASQTGDAVATLLHDLVYFKAPLYS